MKLTKKMMKIHKYKNLNEWNKFSDEWIERKF